jgi:hypothetical protein
MSGFRFTDRQCTTRLCLPVCLLLLLVTDALANQATPTNNATNDRGAAIFADAVRLRAEQREAENVQAI